MAERPTEQEDTDMTDNEAFAYGIALRLVEAYAAAEIDAATRSDKNHGAMTTKWNGMAARVLNYAELAFKAAAEHVDRTKDAGS